MDNSIMRTSVTEPAEDWWEGEDDGSWASDPGSLSASLFIGEASLPVTPLTRVYYEVSVLATLLFGWWMRLLWVLERKLVVLCFTRFSTLKGERGIINGACKRCHLVQTTQMLENKQIRSCVTLMSRANWKHGGKGRWKGNSLTFSIFLSNSYKQRRWSNMIGWMRGDDGKVDTGGPLLREHCKCQM